MFAKKKMNSCVTKCKVLRGEKDSLIRKGVLIGEPSKETEEIAFKGGR